jgi:hypothetical protein
MIQERNECRKHIRLSLYMKRILLEALLNEELKEDGIELQ